MVAFQTLKSEEIKFGRNSFIEISRRQVITPVSENEFIAISRSFYLPSKTKRWRSSISLLSEKNKREKISELIKSF